MSSLSSSLGRIRLLLGCVTVAAVVSLFVMSPAARSTVPSGTQVGTVTYTGMNSGSNVTQQIRRFTWSGTRPNGVPTLGAPIVVQGQDATGPLFLKYIASGASISTVRVSLFFPGTTTPATKWTFYNAVLTTVTDDKSEPSAQPRESVSWGYDKVTEATYQSDGTTLIRTYCFDLNANAAC